MVLMLFKRLSPRPDILDCFFSYRPGLTRAILSDLHSILYLPPKDDRKGTIKIFHASLSDFLLDAKRSGRFFIDLAKSPTTIAKKVLEVLMKSGKLNNCSCTVVAEHTLSDTPRELEVACYAALPVVCVQTKSIDVLKAIYELDLARYVSWYCQLADHLHVQNVNNVVTFFRWMELKVRFNVIASIISER